MTALDQPQTPTDGKVDATPAPETKTPAPAAEAAPSEPAQPKTEEKPLPGLSVKAPEKKEEAARPGAPEKYEWKIEGDPKFVSSITGKFEPMARKLGLSNDEAHGVYDTFAGVMRENTKAVHAQWAQQLQADKEFGGDKLEETLSLANGIVEKYGDDEFRGLLDQAGLRHNPAIVRLLAKVAKDVSGDRMPRVPDHAIRRGEVADAWYPTMKK